jgi:hypothetical protein
MTLGGKAQRSPATRLLIEAEQAFGEEPLSPFAHDLPRGVEASGDDIVMQTSARQQDDLCPDHVTIW